MRMESLNFKANAQVALHDARLQKNLSSVRHKFIDKRKKAVLDFGNDDGAAFEQLRDAGEAIRTNAILHLPDLLTQFERKAQAQGTMVLWAKTPAQAAQMVVSIAQEHGVKKVVKSKSMLSEEAQVNHALAQAGIVSVETDLGEYILQINDNEPPAHIIAPAMHKSKEEVSALFARVHGKPALTDIPQMTREAREVLREHFLTADMGISGGNFLVADTGSVVLVTNEGNGRMCTTLPRIHVALVGIEKVIASLNDLSVLLRLLTRSATGQNISNYVSVVSGTKRPSDTVGPEINVVILVDGERSALVGGRYQSMLQCIRCGACMNHCPVFHSLGGHPYGWVYPGPMGSILTPLFQGLKNAQDLPQAATLCNQCGSACPVRIPLADLLRQLREDSVDQKIRPLAERWALGAWAIVATRPWLFRLVGRFMARSLRLLAQDDGHIHHLPFPRQGWTTNRYFPAPEGKTFMEKHRAQ